jgi:glycosyltransferase involved in cell wall biosynthesis
MHVLPKVMGAIEKQTFPQNNIKILLVDGGSSDDTLKYGKSRGCQIIVNPRTEPVYAKYLGFLHCKTRYLVYLDHDEVYFDENCLTGQVRAILEAGVKTVLSAGYINPEGEHPINDYINEFGDPFSCFIYNLSKSPDRFISEMTKRYIVNDHRQWVEVDFGDTNQLPLIELLAMGTLIDVSFFKEQFPDFVSTPENLPHLFYMLMTKETKVAICKRHILVHYSSESVKGYLNKISWRIKNNIHHTEGVGAAGFLVREQLMSSREKGYSRFKKFLFLPYALLILPCLIGTTKLLLTRRKYIYAIHLPLSIYTAGQIVYHQCLKTLGYKPKLTSYDGSKVVEND